MYTSLLLWQLPETEYLWRIFILTFCRQDSPRSRYQQHHCLKRNVLCVQDNAVCCSSGVINACLHNRKTMEERGNVCWNFKPFCKGVSLILKDGVCIAQSPPTDWASVCVPLRMMGQSDVLEGTQSLKLWLFVISTLYLWMYNLLYTFSHFLVGSVRLSHCPELGSRFKSGC